MQPNFNSSSNLLIETKSKSYPVYIGDNVRSELVPFLLNLPKKPTKICIVTDDKVATLYLDDIKQQVSESFQTYHYMIPSGEASKNFDQYYMIQTYLLEQGFDRNSLILALGGGVVGDLAGFVAATYMRGIRFIQMPTTLLAHDSAVGGKVAINHSLGKNMIGAFYQPEAVLYDVSFLRSLSERELRSGFAEVIKHGLIKDQTFFHWLEQKVLTIHDLNKRDIITTCIEKGIQIKAEVVKEDETESGVRAILNFGHTAGHAVENYQGYGTFLHGDAVAIGMLIAAKISEELNGFQQYNKILKMLERFGFPTALQPTMNAEKIVAKMKKDKKSKDGHIHMVLISRIGEVYVQPVEDYLVLEVVTQFIPKK
ncbi:MULTISPECIES: 3-dehydroquinate synthase [Bacillus]|uniref:3-dehydroquinate synthase n=1 Tax=Bacillus TaxID=1386 RepID=UPI000BB88C51|nr:MULTISPECIES: 3-dehydroquinate synthase [Bacillus]